MVHIGEGRSKSPASNRALTARGAEQEISQDLFYFRLLLGGTGTTSPISLRDFISLNPIF